MQIQVVRHPELNDFGFDRTLSSTSFFNEEIPAKLAANRDITTMLRLELNQYQKAKIWRDIPACKMSGAHNKSESSDISLQLCILLLHPLYFHIHPWKRNRPITHQSIPFWFLCLIACNNRWFNITISWYSLASCSRSGTPTCILLPRIFLP